MSLTQPVALIVSHDKADMSHFANMLKAREFFTHCAMSINDAEKWLDQHSPDLALIALDMPEGDSLELLQHQLLQHETEIILTSHEEDIERVRKGISAGASYYFCFPSDEGFLTALLNDMLAEFNIETPERDLLSNVTPIDQFGLLRGRSKPMRNVYRMIRKVAPTDTSVFVHGESGTGKELVAHTIHMFSDRRDEAFIALNCGAIPKDLIESELFGHEKGSFSGADKRHIGFFERAHKGTLFLDEVTEMPEDLQIKFLRVLESGHFRRIGGEQDKTSDVRIVAASNRIPDEALAEGKLREDLYFRIANFPIRVPALRERGDDIKGLLQYFLNAFNTENGTQKTVEEETLAKLQDYHWPGNVRELSSLLNQAYIMASNVITVTDLPPFNHDLGQADSGQYIDSESINVPIGETLKSCEKRLILSTLKNTEGDKTQAAEILGVSLKTLYNRLNEYKNDGDEKIADKENSLPY